MSEYPIDTLRVKQFGPFGELNIQFSPQLNVVVGDNGTGKTQLLKLLYASTKSVDHGNLEEPSKTHLATSVATKLIGVFKPDSLGRLASRVRGRSKADVSVKFKGVGSELAFNFASSADNRVKVESVPNRRLEDTAVFLPSRELLSIYPGLISLYESREVSFDETWRDTAVLLGMTPLLGPRGDRANQLLEPILEILEGSVVEENGDSTSSSRQQLEERARLRPTWFRKAIESSQWCCDSSSRVFFSKRVTCSGMSRKRI